jgi:hypothetical protein
MPSQTAAERPLCSVPGCAQFANYGVFLHPICGLPPVATEGRDWYVGDVDRTCRFLCGEHKAKDEGCTYGDPDVTIEVPYTNQHAYHATPRYVPMRSRERMVRKCENASKWQGASHLRPGNSERDTVVTWMVLEPEREAAIWGDADGYEGELRRCSMPGCGRVAPYAMTWREWEELPFCQPHALAVDSSTNKVTTLRALAV